MKRRTFLQFLASVPLAPLAVKVRPLRKDHGNAMTPNQWAAAVKLNPYPEGQTLKQQTWDCEAVYDFPASKKVKAGDFVYWDDERKVVAPCNQDHPQVMGIAQRSE